MAKEKVDTYQIITDIIIDKLEQGIVPWQKPWRASSDWPSNYITDKRYRGINVFILLLSGYDVPYWMTFKQVSDKGGKVKKGEKSTPIVFWNKYKKTLDNGDTEDLFTIKYYRVFNIEQTEGIEYEVPKYEELDFNPIEKCEEVISSSTRIPNIRHEGKKAYYHPVLDYINMPDKSVFHTIPDYYATLFHEIGHSTGHKDRLNRKTLTDTSSFGSHSYSREELVAEFFSSIMCAETEISNSSLIDNSVSYIKGWLKVLKDDPKLVIQGAAQAQKAADYILNIKFEEKIDA